MRTLLLLLLLSWVPGPLVADEETGAKTMFRDPYRNSLSFSPDKSKAKPPSKQEQPKDRKLRPPTRPPGAPDNAAQSATPEPAPRRSIGIRFWVRQVDSQGNVLAETQVGQVFRSGERIQLLVESNADAYLAIVQEGADGRAGLLYPPHESELGADRIPAHARVIVPGARQAFTFDHNAGTERLFIILVSDRNELASLPLGRRMEAADVAALRRLAARETGAKNLILETLSGLEDSSTYAVNLVGSAIVQEIALVHVR